MSYAIQSEINATVPQVLEIVIVVSPHTPVYLFFPFMFSIFEFGRSRLNKTDTSALRPPIVLGPFAPRRPVHGIIISRVSH